jgi:protocatechuate 3,4-dioxygenase beta subunit
MKRRTFLTSALLGTGATVLSPPARAAASAAVPGELTAQTTEGPYYLTLDLMRADITEGMAGIPMDIVLTVLDLDGRPSTGALVDIWHANPDGHYSGFEQPGAAATGKTFLRGTQAVGADGTVTFHSLYPGWYEGRTTHIHFKVRRGPLTNLTSQFFLPDTLSEFLYTQVSAYRRKMVRDTLNSTDGIAIQAGPTVEGNVREANGRYVATLTVRVDPTANPSVDRPPAPGHMPDGAQDHALPAMMPPPKDGQMPPKDHPPGRPGGVHTLQGDERVAALLPSAERVAAMSSGAPPQPPKA